MPVNTSERERDNGRRLLAVNAVNLPVRSYRFDDHGAPSTFFIVIGTRVPPIKTLPPRRKRIGQRAVACARPGAARRKLGAQMLEVVVWGYDDHNAANEALQRQLAQIIRLG